MCRLSWQANAILWELGPVKFSSLVFFAVVLATVSAAFAQQPGSVLIPTKYVDGTFYAEPVTEHGDRLSFYTDTGGGLWIKKNAVDKDKLPTAAEGERTVLKPWPKFKQGQAIPEPLGGLVTVMPEGEKLPGWARDWDGMLGQQWFSGRIWTFDYPKQQLWLRDEKSIPRIDGTHTVSLGFQADASGKHSTDFPRITVRIDGENLDLLFDTGAQTFLAAPARDALKLGSEQRAASFITKSTSDKWHKNHPQWRYIEKAEEETSADMIQVPQVEVGGYTVGLVWFTVRPDKAFHEYMAQWMDKPVEGALGGSALHYFRVTVDYVNAKAYFEK